MIVNRSHFSWGLVTLLASAGTAWLYFANNNPELLDKWHISLPFRFPESLGPVPPLRNHFGSTPLGLIYGTVALAIFIFAALLGWKRNTPTWKFMGRIQFWLRAHIWLTIFTIPLVVFHCGFFLGGGMTQFLMLLYAFVMLSGFWGLALQNLVPRLMRDYLPEEVVYEQIPFIRSQLVAEAEALKNKITAMAQESDSEHSANKKHATHTAAIKSVLQFIEEEGMPFLNNNMRKTHLRHKPTSDNLFRIQQLQLPPVLHPLLEKFHDICDSKRQIDLQARMHGWLHGWILFHAPASILLVVLTLVHALVAGFLYA